MEGENDGTRGGGGGGGRGDEEGWRGRRGMFEYDGESCCAMRGCCIAAEQNARRLLSTAAAISCSPLLKFIGDSPETFVSPDSGCPFNGTTRSPAVIPARSIDLPRTRILDRASRSRRLVARTIFLTRSVARFSLIHLALTVRSLK